MIAFGIDDNNTDDTLEIQVLEPLDIKCRKAKNREDALSELKVAKPDIIIIINSLKEIEENEGIKICEMLHKNGNFSTIPVILHSVSITKSIRENEKDPATLPKNIVNKFSVRDALVIKDLIIEIFENINDNHKS